MFRLPGGWYLTPTRHLLAGQGQGERRPALWAEAVWP